MIQIYILFVQNLGLLLSLLRGVAYRLSFQVIFFLSGLLFAAIAGPQLFGVMSLMIVNAAALFLITGMGTDASLVWHGAGNELTHERSFAFAAGSALLQLFLFLLAEWIVLTVTGRTLLSREAGNKFLVPEILYFTGLILTEKYTSLFYSHNKAISANKALCIVAFIFLIVFSLIYLKLLPETDPVFIFSVMTFVMGITLATVFHLKIQGIVFAWINKPTLRSLLTFSGLIFITNIIQFFAYRIDYWIIDLYHGHGQLGIYAQATRFAQLMWVIPAIVAGLLIPALRSESAGTRDSSKDFPVLSRWMNLINLLVMAIVIGSAWFFYNLFLQKEFFAGWPALLLMLPGYFFFASTTLLAAWFSIKRMLLVNLYGSILCFIVIFIADLALIPEYSIKGAAIANSIAYCITTFYFIYQYKRKGEGNLKDLIILKKKDLNSVKKIISN